MEVRANEIDAIVNEVTNGGNASRASWVDVGTGKRKRKQSKGFGQGTRCSRINGRGWQCRETTLPNYALCEYHLGLARLRSQELKAKKK
ncbi:hypothetical protein AQUCO_00900169v1 [Aquilegia coerulea]|uniref:WRC domain-containing protein n=1 Tax=Aquilegia coerulea TaxID=218851 RepID=A0A2G5ECC0_AQUCA|nr:hypothetical protein AQUCO_00900169v1 [Aquilegia coerulea]